MMVLLFQFVFSQKQTEIKYLQIRSPVANVYETLITDGKRVLSKQDGNIIWTDPDYQQKTKKGLDQYFVSMNSSDLSSRIFTFNSYLIGEEEIIYWVKDIVPQYSWNIDKNSTKKILGYQCYKATTVFRGSPITAFFTYEIPHSIGPFKFYGLPGAILDVRVDGKSFDIWKAVEVKEHEVDRIEYPSDYKNSQRVSMQEFVKAKDEAVNKYMNGANLKGSVISIPQNRIGIEQVFEWEK